MQRSSSTMNRFVLLIASTFFVACGARDGFFTPLDCVEGQDCPSGGTGGVGATGGLGGTGAGGFGGTGAGGFGGTGAGGFGGTGAGGFGGTGAGGFGGTGGGTNDCCSAHDSPGCFDPAITACVCAVDPFCCNVQWDQLCVDEVTSLGCGSCGGTGGFGGGGFGGMGGFGGGGFGGVGGTGGFGGFGGTGGVGGVGGTGGIGGTGGTGGTGGIGGSGGTGGVGGTGGTGGIGGTGGTGGIGGSGGTGGIGGTGGTGGGGTGGTGGGCAIGDCDGDGWTVADGDCCDVPGPCSVTPELVNPGAIEYIGNAVDDDCDGFFDEVDPPCDNQVSNTNTSNPLDYAKAMDLCQTTQEVLPIKDRKWGVISGKLTLANGSGTPNPVAHAVRPKFGSAIFPLKGQRLGILSTGAAAAPTDTNPPYTAFQPGRDNQRQSGFPADWLAASGGVLPNSPGCPAPNGSVANDPVMLTLRIRVPTNARSFSFNSFFASSEFPEYVCTPFNDFFVALVDSGATTNPVNKNVAVYIAPNFQRFPISVNLSFGTNLFAVCDPGPTGCAGGVPGNANCIFGPSLLGGTGFDANTGGCGTPPNSSDLMGGGTGWLTTAGNVVPGEIMEIRIAVWDTSDAVFDSLVLLDNWIWNLSPAQPGTR